MKLFVTTVYVDDNASIAAQLSCYLRGQWVMIRGMRAWIVQIVNGRAVLWMNKDKMIAVFG